MKKNKKNQLLLWGDGKAKRELIYVDDIANACIFFMKKKTKHSIINIGSGKDYSIEYYARLFAKVILKNQKIFIKYDKSKPDGTPRKIMDISIAKKYGWKPNHNLKTQILKTYKSYLSKIDNT